MYEANISLKEQDYRNLMYWSLFCRNKLLTVLLILIYGYGMLTLSTMVNSLSNIEDSMLMSLAISVLCLVMPIISITTHERRIRQTLSKNNIENLTRKRVTLSPNHITIYRVEKNQLNDYTWDDVEGIYNTKSSVIMCMKNKQILPIYAQRNSPETLTFVQDMAKEKNLNRFCFSGKAIIIIILAITLLGMILGVPQAA